MTEKIYQNDLKAYSRKYSEIAFDAWKEFQDNIISQLIKEFATGKLALDYGCGAGKSTSFLQRLGYIVEAVDVNEHILQEAERGNNAISYTLIKSGEIPKDDNYYDLVYACWVLTYSKTKEELIKICCEIARVLKKGGTFVVVADHITKYNQEWLAVDTSFDENKNLTSGSVVKTKFRSNNLVVYTYYWTEEDYSEALRKAGFSIVHIYRPPSYSNLSQAEKEAKHSYTTIYVAQKI